MIDCGATHNFISQRLADELKLPRSETTNYGVIMGSGEAVKGKGICPGIVVVENFLPLELGTLDVVLGMQC